MSAELYVHSDIPPLSWDEFRATHAAGSIALDGYVADGPQFDESGPFLNANHHEKVDRLATLSSAQQVLMLVRMGLDKAFQKDGEFMPQVHVNDCDQDVCTAWFLLHHVDQAKNVANPALNRFVQVAGTLDVTAGAFPYDRNLEILSEQAWVFEPYTSFRASGEMAKKDNAQYKSVIESVELRIQQHLLGRGGKEHLDTRYKTIGGGDGWKMIVEEGQNGRVGALVDGVDAYVFVQQTQDERWRYTIGRRSRLIPFNVPDILALLNTIEECASENGWGGADIIGGSPRVGDSKLSPAEVEAAINTFLKK